ncbi:unnamed protein product [marine sediment metagenome]|uniref:Uncharacterized protein n=1 Tax=marine sediment metagenome TaxID=412755 RepID=X1A8I4_9ZZZZ
MDFKDMTINELQSRIAELHDEIDDIEIEIDDREVDVPKILPDSETNDKLIRQYVQGYLTDIMMDGGSKDFKNYLYETIMETYYTSNIWDWINAHQKW